MLSDLSEMHRRFEISGDLFSGVRCRVLEPFSGVCKPQSSVYDMASSSYPAFQMSGSIDGTTINAALTPYTLALSPLAMPNYFAVSSTTWDTGTCFADSNVLQSMCRSFGKYRVHSLTFHYKPNASTGDDALLAFAYSEDPSHPLIGVSEFSTSNYPGISTCENSANSISFAPWLPWSMRVPVDPSTRYMAIDGVFASATTSVVYDAADIRHTNFGSVCLLSSQKSADGATRVGELYWEIDVELMDPTPQYDKHQIPLLLKHGLICHGEFNPRKLSKCPPPLKASDIEFVSSDDDDDPPPPPSDSKLPVVEPSSLTLAPSARTAGLSETRSAPHLFRSCRVAPDVKSTKPV